jgi:8-oxo-dGTP pyrophosphatase MutT (NUDIX family)
MTLLVAAVVVHDQANDSVLLLRRGPNAKHGRGKWDVPVGKNDPGESIIATAVRELEEETGLRVAPADLTLAHVAHGAWGVEAPNGFLTVFFRATTWQGEAVNREPQKHSDVRWFPLTALPAPDAFVLSTGTVLPACVSGNPPSVALHGWSR